MLSKLFITPPVVKRSVASVISAFSQAIEDLHTVAAEQQVEADLQHDLITKAAVARAEALSEVANAKVVIGKMQEIFQPAVFPEAVAN